MHKDITNAYLERDTGQLKIDANYLPFRSVAVQEAAKVDVIQSINQSVALLEPQQNNQNQTHKPKGPSMG